MSKQAAVWDAATDAYAGPHFDPTLFIERLSDNGYVIVPHPPVENVDNANAFDAK